jgi:cellulose synthase/poly-beta-1,6-N-acetylglucosamine synthase-like glycosyltransferase
MPGVRPEISVVIPSYNEAPNLAELHQSFTEVLESLKLPYELIVVDDGSTDGSIDLLRALQATDRRVRIIIIASVNGPAWPPFFSSTASVRQPALNSSCHASLKPGGTRT